MLRLIHVVGTREVARVYWGNDCPNTYGLGTIGTHVAMRTLRVLPEVPKWDAEKQVWASLGDHPEVEVPPEAWPTKCDHCPAPAPPDANRQFVRTEHFDTPSGDAEPNDCWYDDIGPHPANFWCPWTNCDGKHLTIVLPVQGYREGHSVRGLRWEPGHRARNCTMPQDTVHRCWVIAGEAPRLSSVGAPNHCNAGKCSIEVGSVFHKTLRDGEWV